MIRRAGLIGLLFACLIRCGQGSMVECGQDLAKETEQSNCTPKTDDERAMLALNSGDLDLAKSLLEALIEAHPLEYFRYPRLASVYASLAGFDLTDISSFGGGGGSGGDDSFLGSVGRFLPTPEADDLDGFSQKVDLMGQAKEILMDMPAAHRTKGSEYFYAASAELQLTLYSSAFSVMYMNQFAIPSTDGSGDIDPDRLRDITAEDAVIILQSLADAADSSDESPENAAAIREALAEIESQEGENDREKIIAFLEADGGGS